MTKPVEKIELINETIDKLLSSVKIIMEDASTGHSELSMIIDNNKLSRNLPKNDLINDISDDFWYAMNETLKFLMFTDERKRMDSKKFGVVNA